MKKKIFKERTEAVSKTIFLTDGTMINRVVQNQPVLVGDDNQKKIPGRIVHYSDGESIFMPYATGGEHNFVQLEKTQHCVLKEYPKSLVLKMKLSKTMSAQEVMDAIIDELNALAVVASIYLKFCNAKKEEVTK